MAKEKPTDQDSLITIRLNRADHEFLRCAAEVLGQPLSHFLISAGTSAAMRDVEPMLDKVPPSRRQAAEEFQRKYLMPKKPEQKK